MSDRSSLWVVAGTVEFLKLTYAISTTLQRFFARLALTRSARWAQRLVSPSSPVAEQWSDSNSYTKDLTLWIAGFGALNWIGELNIASSSQIQPWLTVTSAILLVPSRRPGNLYDRYLWPQTPSIGHLSSHGHFPASDGVRVLYSRGREGADCGGRARDLSPLHRVQPWRGTCTVHLLVRSS